MTKRERHWLKHIQAGEAYSGSAAAYARENDLKVKDFYQWKTRLRRRGLLSDSAKRADATVSAQEGATGDFVRVSVPTSAPIPTLTLSVQLPNGVQLSFQGDLGVEQLRSVMIAANELT